MGKLYTLDNKLLVGSPEVRIGDKMYPVDDRTSTVKKMTALKEKDNSDEEILKLAFGNAAYSEIKAMDMPFKAHLQLIKIAVAAMTGEDEEEIDARFQEETGSK